DARQRLVRVRVEHQDAAGPRGGSPARSRIGLRCGSGRALGRGDLAQDRADLATRSARNLGHALEDHGDVPDAVSEPADDGAVGGLREARRRDQPDANAVERLLDDLALAHREPVEHGAQPEDAPAVARNQEIAAPPVDAGDYGQRTAAGARLGRGPEAPAVTDAIADQRHIGVDEAGANELSINGLGDPDLGPEMELAGLAFTSRRDVLVHTVGLAHG